MSWKRPGEIINKILRNSAGPIKDSIEKAWREIDYIKEKGNIVTFKKGTLIVKVKNSACLQEMSLQREKIKQDLNQKIEKKIKEIRFRLGG